MATTVEIIWGFCRNLKGRLYHWQWLHRFDAEIKKHQLFEKNHRQRKWYINASIRG